MTRTPRFLAVFLILTLLLTGCAAQSPAPPASTTAAASTASAVASSPSSTAGSSTTAATTSASAAPAAQTCALTIRCDTILENRDVLNPEKADLVPEDGLLYENPAAEITDGESAFDLLLRETRAAGIHLDFVKTPAYNTVYVRGIGNLYEFDCGDLSGWTYRINGEFLSVGCSLAVIHPGDTVEFLYTCDLGADVGNVWTGE